MTENRVFLSITMMTSCYIGLKFLCINTLYSKPVGTNWLSFNLLLCTQINKIKMRYSHGHTHKKPECIRIQMRNVAHISQFLKTAQAQHASL